MIDDIYSRLLQDIIKNDPSILATPLSIKELGSDYSQDPAKHLSYLINFIYQNNIHSELGLLFGENIVALNICDFLKMITSASTLEECLNDTVRIYHTLNLKPFPNLHKHGETSSLSICYPYNSSTSDSSRRFSAEVFFSYGLDLFRKSINSNIIPSKVYLDFDKPAYAHRYDELFNCEIIYNAPLTLIEFPTEVLATPLPTKNDLLHNTFISKALETWTQNKKTQRFKYRACTLLMNQSPYNFCSDNLANSMSISTRGLQKKLATEGTSYSQVCKQTRTELAKICLFQKGMDFEETANILGFQTQVSFRKFFKEQFGDNPKTYMLSKSEQLEPA